MGSKKRVPSKPGSYRMRRWKVLEAQRRQVVLDLFKKNGGRGRVLDFGCGRGLLLEMLSELENVELVGIDIDGVAIKEAGQRLKGKNVELRVGSLGAIEDDERFNCIICGEVLEHLNNPEEYMSVFPRYMVKGGLYIVVLPYLWELINCPRDAIIHRSLSNIKQGKMGTFERLFFKRDMGVIKPTWLTRTFKPKVHEFEISDYTKDYMKGEAKGGYHKHWFDYRRLKRMLEASGFEPKELVYVSKRQYMISVSTRT